MTKNEYEPNEEFKSPLPAEELSETIEIPSTEILPPTTHERYQLSSREIDALVKNNPDMILKLIQENQQQQREQKNQRFELEKIKLENQHSIEKKQEENRQKTEQQKVKIVGVSIAAFCMIFAGALIYSARVNDKNLPNTIITAAISLLAGGSTSVVAFSRRKTDVQNINDGS